MSKPDAERPILIIQDENQPAQHWSMSKDSMVLGRGEECDIVLAERQISRQHIRIYKESDLFYIQDLDSKNGTWVNGQQVKGTRELRDGDDTRRRPHGTHRGQDRLADRQQPPALPSHAIGQRPDPALMGIAFSRQEARGHRGRGDVQPGIQRFGQEVLPFEQHLPVPRGTPGRQPPKTLHDGVLAACDAFHFGVCRRYSII